MNRYDPDLTEAINEAIGRNDAGEVNNIIRKGCNINTSDKNETYPLINAVVKRRSEIMPILLKAGADINIQDNCGFTPLMYAVTNRNMTMAIMLLAAGADINICNKDIKTALILSVVMNNIGMTDMLIKNGADVNVTDYKGDTPLIHASQNRYSACIIGYLIDAGADPHVINLDGKTALHYAAEKGSIESVKALAGAGMDINAVDKGGRTVLWLSTQNISPSPAVTEFFIESGADVNAKNHDDVTVLMRAAQYGNTAIVDMLIKAGATVCDLDQNNNNTALHYAAAFGSIHMMKSLIKAGADLYAENSTGRTPLDIFVLNHPRKFEKYGNGLCEFASGYGNRKRFRCEDMHKLVDTGFEFDI